MNGYTMYGGDDNICIGYTGEPAVRDHGTLPPLSFFSFFLFFIITNSKETLGFILMFSFSYPGLPPQGACAPNRTRGVLWTVNRRLHLMYLCIFAVIILIIDIRKKMKKPRTQLLRHWLKMTFDGMEVSEMTQGFLILVCMIVLVRMYVFLW